MPPLTHAVVASRNPGKAGELRRLFRASGWNLLQLDQAPGGEALDWVEDGTTYRENALIKARAVLAATGMAALGDDSGLELAAFDGWPGLRTARWMGEGVGAQQLLQGLIRKLEPLPPEQRRATFVCSLALALPGPQGAREVLAEARLPGTLLVQPRGRLGFGYDPIFVPLGEQRAMAEMSQSHKDAISHRGQAARQLLARLEREGLAPVP